MDDWIYGVLLIISAVVGTISGVYGQTLKEWISRPKLVANVTLENGYQVMLYLQNGGKKSTRCFSLSVFFIISNETGPISVYFHKNIEGYEIDPNTTIRVLLGEKINDKVKLYSNYEQTIEGRPIFDRVDMELPLTMVAVVSAQDVEGANYKIVVDSQKVQCTKISVTELVKVIEDFT